MRDKFPFFKLCESVYFDSAATTQKPGSVIDAVSDHLSAACANAGRGIYALAHRAASEIEACRAATGAFIGASSPSEVVFTAGCTDSLQRVAVDWAESALEDGDEILVAERDHKATVDPWTAVAARLAPRGVRVAIRRYGHLADGRIDSKSLQSQVGPKTRLVMLTHGHNVFGVINDVAAVAAALPEHIVVGVDAAQTVGHRRLDVSALGADFVAFSAHKMFGVAGTGVLWCAPAWKESPVSRLGAKEFERGTQNLPGIVALRHAITFITDHGHEAMARHTANLTRMLAAELGRHDSIVPMTGSWRGIDFDLGILSFSIDGIRADDVGHFLDMKGICARTGSHCLTPGSTEVDAVRFSLQCYCTESDVSRAVDAIDELVKHSAIGRGTRFAEASWLA